MDIKYWIKERKCKNFPSGKNISEIFCAVFLICFLFYNTHDTHAQNTVNVQVSLGESKNPEKNINPNLPFEEEPLWVAPIFLHSEDLLQKYPPQFPIPVPRQEALMLLDGPLHMEKANRFKSSYEFLLRRMESAVISIENAKVEKGAKIWRLYNHGFVVKTPSVTIGFDIVRGWTCRESPDLCYGMPPELSRRLLNQIDVLSVSHNHGDHFDREIIRLFLEQKKPVIVPPDAASRFPGNPLVLNPRDDRLQKEPESAPSFFTLNLSGGRSVQYAAYPGRQGPIALNNIAFFKTAENISFMHTGDQSGNEDWDWIDRVKDFNKVDILMVNCWTPDMWRLIRGLNPGIVVTGHETEMGHVPDHREAYWRSLQIFRDQTDMPAYTLFWGEAINFPIQIPNEK